MSATLRQVAWASGVAASAQQVAADVEAQTEEIQGIDEMARGLSGDAEELTHYVSSFQVESTMPAFLKVA